MKTCKRVVLVTMDGIPGTATEILGVVSAAICFSKSAIGDMAANVKNWSVGGELDGYTHMLETATDRVLKRLAEHAAQAGADAVVALRLQSTTVTAGAAELVAYGTAVRLLGNVPGEETGDGCQRQG